MKKITVLLLICALLVPPVFPQDEEEGIIPSLKFKEADITVVLQAISRKATKDGERVNIIIGPEIEGFVTVDLEKVHWKTALEAVLKMYNYGYEWIGDEIIMVTTLEKLAEKRQQEAAAALQEPLQTVTYALKYLDANDVKKLMDPQLTSRGTISVLELEVQKGWKARGGFGAGSGATGGDFERAEREEGAKPRTKKLIITDTKSNVVIILEAIRQIDIRPRQVLIEARIMEVNRDKLKDIGIEYGTGTTGITGSTATERGMSLLNVDREGKRAMMGAMKSNVAPSVFDPKSEDIRSTSPYNAGMEVIFRRLQGAQFEAVLHALEEDVNTNTLSAPRILTLDGQEAYIMVGEKRPIIESEIEASEGSVGISKSLSYYQNLGIELNVVPHICDDGYIDMLVYPSVTSSSSNIDATSQIGETTSTDSYPIIKVRETQTQVILKDGETIGIGGLLKDVKSEGVVKVPILGDIPLLGLLFQRKTYDTEKIDLVVFITVRILDSSDILPEPDEAELAAVIEDVEDIDDIEEMEDIDLPEEKVDLEEVIDE